jgi:L-cysteate sulfo-lyase
MKTPDQIRALLASQPHTTLGFYPTPLHKLERVSAEHDIELYVKREDFSGMSLFGGNKMRKLEYILGDALAKGCDTLVTYGATQSNHAMQTATAARKCGMTPVLFLVALVEPDAQDVRANMLLNTILGAQVHILTPQPGESMGDTFIRCRPQIDATIRELESRGHKVYDLPAGGSTPVGVLGYIHAFAELVAQLEDIGVAADSLFMCTGTGATLAGLVAGKALTGSLMQIVGMRVVEGDSEAYAERIVTLGKDALGLIGEDVPLSPADFALDDRYFAPGYEMPSAAANDDIRYLARTEGLFADSVYSGKAFHGMMEYIRSERVPRGSKVVFLHTGGTTALFSEPAIVGDLSTPK